MPPPNDPMITPVSVSEQGKNQLWTVPKRAQDPRPAGYVMPNFFPSTEMGMPSISFPLVSRSSSKRQPVENVVVQQSDHLILERSVIYVIPVYILVVIFIVTISAVVPSATNTCILVFSPIW